MLLPLPLFHSRYSLFIHRFGQIGTKRRRQFGISHRVRDSIGLSNPVEGSRLDESADHHGLEYVFELDLPQVTP